jgi:hypothetical protein
MKIPVCWYTKGLLVVSTLSFGFKSAIKGKKENVTCVSSPPYGSVHST